MRSLQKAYIRRFLNTKVTNVAFLLCLKVGGRMNEILSILILVAFGLFAILSFIIAENKDK